MVPEALHTATNKEVPSGVTHIGFVPTNVAREVLVTDCTRLL